MRFARRAGSGIALMLACLPMSAGAQQIQRCEGPGGRITYSNSVCPDGTRAAGEVQSAPAPTPEAQAAARAKAARNAEEAAALARQRQAQQASLVQQQEKERAVHCAYLRGEIDSMHRLRNVMVNRPFYSLDDLRRMDDYATQLVNDHRRLCS